MADHPVFAATYDRVVARSEARGMAQRRGELLARARGRVLEIGAGTGLNLEYYPPDTVASVVALEPDGAMRRRLVARVASGACPVPCEVVGSDVAGARFEAAAFDTVVCTFVLCTVDDPPGAVAAIRRWLAPDGRLLFLEHVRAGGGVAARLQTALTPLWSRVVAGCHLDRDTISVLRGGDFAVTDCMRFPMPAGGPLFRTCVEGVARPRPLTLEAA